MKMRKRYFGTRVRFGEDPQWINCPKCGTGYCNASGICPVCGRHNG